MKKEGEEGSNHRPKHVFVTYIRTTPERLWEAITSPEFTRGVLRIPATRERTHDQGRSRGASPFRPY